MATSISANRTKGYHIEAPATGTLTQMVILFLAAVLALSIVACSDEADWERRDAWRRCDAAISEWPDKPAPPCPALHMCANEAPPSPEARGKLAKMIAATPGCEAL